MRILADENFPGDAVDALQKRGHDVAWAHSDSPGDSDVAILARAQAEHRILLTFDKDFGELAFRSGLPASRVSFSSGSRRRHHHTLRALPLLLWRAERIGQGTLPLSRTNVFV